MNFEPFDGGMGQLGRLTHAEETTPFSFLSGGRLSARTNYQMKTSLGSKTSEKA